MANLTDTRPGEKTGAPFRPNPELAAYWFILPALILLLGLIVYPILSGIFVSFFKTNLINRWQFVGVRYFVDALTSARVWSSLWLTFYYTFFVVAGNLIVGIGLALLLNKAFPGRIIFRAILILPWLFPEVVVALVWRWILNPIYGPLNYLMVLAGYQGPTIEWLNSSGGAMAGIIFASVWKGYPLAMLMMLAGLQSIPKELYEAAELDGANKWNAFLSVTLPGLKPVLLVVVILETVWYLKQFTIPWIMTAGGPVGSTRLISLEILQVGFDNFQFGRAAAMAVIVFMISLAISFVYRKVIRNEPAT